MPDVEGQFIEPFEYFPERKPDEQYQELLSRILSEGRIAQSGMDEGSVEVIGHQMRFDMRNGFPMLTERDLTASSLPENIDKYSGPDLSERPFRMAVRQGLGEIIGFINGARTLEELESYGCKWWSNWITPEKTAKRGQAPNDLGDGSYGVAFHDFPMANGETFNQVWAIVQQIKERPELRSHVITPFIPYDMIRIDGYTQKVVVVPCHGLMHFNVSVDEGTFDLVHWQRSADVPVGLPFNMIHYAAIMAMVGQVTGYKPRELVYQISNAHIYARHTEIAESMLERTPKPFPRLKVDANIDNIFDFRINHFRIADYDAHPPIDMNGTPV